MVVKKKPAAGGTGVEELDRELEAAFPHDGEGEMQVMEVESHAYAPPTTPAARAKLFREIVASDSQYAQPDAKPARTPYRSIFANYENLDEEAARITAEIANLELELEIAAFDLEMIEVIKKGKNGQRVTSFSPADHVSNKPARRKAPAAARETSSAPRAKAGSIQARILEAMGNDPMSAGDILTAVMAKGTDDEPKYRSALFNMKKKGELGYNEASRTYTKP